MLPSRPISDHFGADWSAFLSASGTTDAGSIATTSPTVHETAKQVIAVKISAISKRSMLARFGSAVPPGFLPNVRYVSFIGLVFLLFRVDKFWN